MVPGEISRAPLGSVVPITALAQQFPAGVQSLEKLFRGSFFPMYGDPGGQIPPWGPSPLSRKSDLGEVPSRSLLWIGFAEWKPVSRLRSLNSSQCYVAGVPAVHLGWSAMTSLDT